MRMSPLLDFNGEELVDPSKPSSINNNAVIVLQPSFPLLQQQPLKPISNAASNIADVESSSVESDLPPGPAALNLSTIDPDDIWKMWSVATKAKSSIPQGHRLENLSWRLWHRCVLSEGTSNVIGPNDVLNQTNQNSAPSSSQPYLNDQAGNASSRLGTFQEENSGESTDSTTESLKNINGFTWWKQRPSPGFLQTATEILSNIQQTTNPSRKPSLFSSDTSIISVTPPSTAPDCPKAEGASSSSQAANSSADSNKNMAPVIPKSSSSKGSSRRKKNVQRFMQRYQNRLADISERITQSEASDADDFCPGSSEQEPTTSKSSEPIDLRSAADEEPPEQSDKKTNEACLVTRTPTGNSDPQKPKMSLLTRLLDHNHNQMRRSMDEESFITPYNELHFGQDSGTPLGQTPPVRPSGPVVFSSPDNQIEEMETLPDVVQKIEKPVVISKNNNIALLAEEQRRMSMDSNEGDFTSMMLW